MISTDKIGVQQFVKALYENGIRTVVCSPGSRNAPIVIALDESNYFELFVLHDERSAGFVALGIALERNQPVGVVCTSGSALVNYFPAVTEAYYQSIPLVVISADRPAKWINQGDGQTIMQEGIFGRHIMGEYTVPEFTKDEEIATNVTSLLEKAYGNWKGPVHFNVPLSEPLYQKVEMLDDFHPVQLDFEWPKLSSSDVEAIHKEWNNFARKLILVGQLPANERLQNQLELLSEDPSVLVLVENISNIQGRQFVHCIDRTLATLSDAELAQFQPDLIVSVGGAIISKRIKSFFRQMEDLTHWKVGTEFPEMNTYRALKRSFQVYPTTFFDEIARVEKIAPLSNFGAKWRQKDFLAKDYIHDYLAQLPFCDFTVFHAVLDFIPDNTNLHMANSSVVRYCQLFDPIKLVRYFSNRGTSGIDGSSSTAAGVSMCDEQKLNVLITGDVSFFYDSNAFWNRYLKGNLKVILINNGGGGIFRIIDGPATSSQLEDYFEANHLTSAKGICSSYNVDYLNVSSMQELEKQLPVFFDQSDRPQLLEIFTHSEGNAVHLNNFFKALKNLA